MVNRGIEAKIPKHHPNLARVTNSLIADSKVKGVKVTDSLIAYSKANPYTVAAIGLGTLIAVAPGIIVWPLGYGSSGISSGTSRRSRPPLRTLTKTRFRSLVDSCRHRECRIRQPIRLLPERRRGRLRGGNNQQARGHYCRSKRSLGHPAKSRLGCANDVLG